MNEKIKNRKEDKIIAIYKNICRKCGRAFVTKNYYCNVCGMCNPGSPESMIEMESYLIDVYDLKYIKLIQDYRKNRKEKL